MTKYGSDVCGRMEEERSMSTDHNRCCESLVQEFKPDNIGLEYENPADLVTPQVGLYKTIRNLSMSKQLLFYCIICCQEPTQYLSSVFLAWNERSVHFFFQ